MSQKIPITPEGMIKLRKRLSNLQKVERPRVISAIAAARELGDLKENAEYHAAREEQAFLEGKIKELEGKVANCQVIDVSKFNNTGKIIFGSTVTLLNFENDKEITYRIVGEDEADLKNNKISVTSPLSRGLIGKNEGDELEIKIPKGNMLCKIIKVVYE